jgi:hypothetical protein
MEKDSLIRMYQGKEPKWKDPSATPTPQQQSKPQPKDVEAPSKKNVPERDALLSAFNEKYGVLNLKGKEYDETLARFSEKWNADKEGRKIVPREGSPLGKTNRSHTPAKDKESATDRKSSSLASLKFVD